MRQRFSDPAGKVQTLWLDSKVLQGNPLGDPPCRRLDVYLPHGQSGAGLPLLVDLAGFLSGGPAHGNWKNFGENLPERLDRLIASGELPPVVVALPDCFTRLGGNQYINSSAIGPWADFLLAELVPYVEGLFHCGGSGRRGIFGKSSGGYGAITHALLYPDFWAAAACHSGDMGFELVYLPAFPSVLRALASHNMNIEDWLTDFFEKPKQGSDDLHTLLTLAMCASFDPDPGSWLGIRLPVDLHTCEIIPERWHNFMRWDPIRIAAEKAAGLKGLKALYIDCGTEDQYNLLYGARRLHRLLEQQGVAHSYTEFKDNHSGIDYRMDQSLPLLGRALTG
ncbi:MAG: alpha/beta hydrolase-fold protein [Pseudomonadales bacterium]|nr:alpha/beta hydrolase-fold protein [Pseudomonadales bacterium]